MKYLKRFVEGVGIVNVNGRHKQYRLKNLPHVGSPIDNGNSILQQDWFEKLLPDTLSVCSIPNIEKINKDLTLSKIDTSDKIYTLEKNDCTIDKDLVQFNYYQNTIKNPEDVVEDGEPDSSLNSPETQLIIFFIVFFYINIYIFSFVLTINDLVLGKILVFFL